MIASLQNTKDKNQELVLNITFLKEGFMNVKLEDVKESKFREEEYIYKSSVNINRKERIRRNSNTKGSIIFKNSSECIIQFTGYAYQPPSYVRGLEQTNTLSYHLFKLIIHYRPFLLHLFLDQQIIIILNSNNLLNYETWRTREEQQLFMGRDATQFEDDVNTLWMGNGHGHQQGPLSVGIDFVFKGIYIYI